MNEQEQDAVKWSMSLRVVNNGFVVDVWHGDDRETYVFGSRIELASWVASEMPKAKWETLG